MGYTGQTFQTETSSQAPYPCQPPARRSNEHRSTSHKEDHMDIGVFFFTSAESADPAVVAKKAEDLGFASIWVPEHPVLPVHTTTGYPAAPDRPIPRTVGIISRPLCRPGPGLGHDQHDQARHRHLPGARAQPPAAGQRDRHPGSLLQRTFSVRHWRGLAKRRVRGHGRRFSRAAGPRPGIRCWP